MNLPRSFFDRLSVSLACFARWVTSGWKHHCTRTLYARRSQHREGSNVFYSRNRAPLNPRYASGSFRLAKRISFNRARSAPRFFLSSSSFLPSSANLRIYQPVFEFVVRFAASIKIHFYIFLGYLGSSLRTVFVVTVSSQLRLIQTPNRYYKYR